MSPPPKAENRLPPAKRGMSTISATTAMTIRAMVVPQPTGAQPPPPGCGPPGGGAARRRRPHPGVPTKTVVCRGGRGRNPPPNPPRLPPRYPPRELPPPPKEPPPRKERPPPKEPPRLPPREPPPPPRPPLPISIPPFR